MNISVPVDFSKCAANALAYATTLAKMAQARIFMQHVYTDEDEKLDKEKTNELKQSLAVFYTGNGNRYTDVELQVLEATEMTALAFDPLIQTMDYLVVGTKGAGVLKSVLVGSNTARLIDHVTNPVIVVPEGAQPPKKQQPILLMTDYNPTENFHVFDPLIYLANLFNAEVVILHIQKPGKKYELYKTVEKTRMENYFDGKINYRRETVFHSNVDDEINAYMRGNHYQLICMIVHEHSMFDNLFRKNHTHEMVFHSTIPLLVLNKKNVQFRK